MRARRLRFQKAAVGLATRSHTFAHFANQWDSSFGLNHEKAPRPVSDIPSILGDIDRICGQVAMAMHNSEFQTYGMLTLVVILSALMFPPKDDPDQV